MSACCLRVSLKSEEWVMVETEWSAGIVKERIARGNIAECELLWRSCGIGGLFVEGGGKTNLKSNPSQAVPPGDAADEGIGVLRLRIPCALRRECSAQNDKRLDAALRMTEREVLGLSGGFPMTRLRGARGHGLPVSRASPEWEGGT